MQDLWTPLQVDSVVSYFSIWLENGLSEGKTLKALLSDNPDEVREEDNKSAVESLMAMNLPGSIQYIKKP